MCYSCVWYDGVLKMIFFIVCLWIIINFDKFVGDYRLIIVLIKCLIYSFFVFLIVGIDGLLIIVEFFLFIL